MLKELWLYAVAAAAGIASWVFVAWVGDRREAWDSEWYWPCAIPFVCLVAAGLGWLEPRRSWRWGLTPLMAQAAWMITTDGAGNLLPIGLVVFGVLSIPPIIAARIGAIVGRKRNVRSPDGPPPLDTVP